MADASSTLIARNSRDLGEPTPSGGEVPRGGVRLADRLVLFTSGEPSVEDQALMSFARWMGVVATAIPISNLRSVRDLIPLEPARNSECFGISAETLRRIGLDQSGWLELKERLLLSETSILIYGWSDSPELQRPLVTIGDGYFEGTNRLGSGLKTFRISASSIDQTAHLAGMEFAAISDGRICGFNCRGESRSVEPILVAQETPVFVRMELGKSHLYLLGAPIANLDASVASHEDLAGRYAGVIPALAFLRKLFGERCWSGTQKTARVIIDDPMLQDHYGFLELNKLSDSMTQLGYGTSIAFIPWNWWRTKRKEADKLKTRAPQLTICVHGCDHTNREYATTDAGLLGRKAGLGMQRMRAQEGKTGAPFEPVMVFPQGRFSRAAGAALNRNEYLAAVNSTCFPVDCAADDIKLGDLLRPAVASFDGFPVFHRHYPNEVFAFAFDLFLGRPALAVEHHEYFRGGCSALEGFVQTLQEIEPELSWPSLEEQLERCSIQRTCLDETKEILFYTRTFRYTNTGASTEKLLLSKREPVSEKIAGVEINGHPVEYSIAKGYLKVQAECGAGEQLLIRILAHTPDLQEARPFGNVYNFKVLIRRALSEFRDQTLSRHDSLLRVAKSAVRAVKATGDS